MSPKLTLGPLLFNWPVDKWRDFYASIADEAPVDTVYLGEVVCSKRAPLFEKHLDNVADRLLRAGKKVIFSSLAEVAMKHDRKLVEKLCARDDIMVEANDASALYALRGREHTIGALLNVYNEDAMAFLVRKGAVHFSLSPELPGKALAVLAATAKKLDVTTEVQVYGRISLALSARCYHARALGRVKDNCQYACEKDPDGMVLQTLAEQDFLAVNGIQTLTLGCLNLTHELPALTKMGINAFRLSPHNTDMVEVANIFAGVMKKRFGPDEASSKLKALWPAADFVNGFYYKEAGYKWVDAA